jgi:hypothetical protein
VNTNRHGRQSPSRTLAIVAAITCHTLLAGSTKSRSQAAMLSTRRLMDFPATAAGGKTSAPTLGWRNAEEELEETRGWLRGGKDAGGNMGRMAGLTALDGLQRLGLFGTAAASNTTGLIPVARFPPALLIVLPSPLPPPPFPPQPPPLPNSLFL